MCVCVCVCVCVWLGGQRDRIGRSSWESREGGRLPRFPRFLQHCPQAPFPETDYLEKFTKNCKAEFPFKDSEAYFGGLPRWLSGLKKKKSACQCTETQETQVQSLGQEDALEEESATHSSILPWKIPWTEEPGDLQSIMLQRVRHNWAHTQTGQTLPVNQNLHLNKVSRWLLCTSNFEKGCPKGRTNFLKHQSYGNMFSFLK